MNQRASLDIRGLSKRDLLTGDDSWETVKSPIGYLRSCLRRRTRITPSDCEYVLIGG